MRFRPLIPLGLASLSLFASLSLAESEIITTVPPPPLKLEIAPTARDGYLWSPGHWEWSGRSYFWVPGNWVVQRRNAHYVESQWTESGGSWHFAKAHWER